MKLLQVAMTGPGRVAELNQSGAELHVEKVSLELICLIVHSSFSNIQERCAISIKNGELLSCTRIT